MHKSITRKFYNSYRISTLSKLYFLLNKIKVSLNDILECYAYYKEKYKDKQNLTLDEFDDIFSPILSNSKEYFKSIEQNDIIDLKEAVIPLFLFCKGLTEEKLEWTVRLYEKEEKKILKDEVIELIQHSARGVWKLVFFINFTKIRCLEQEKKE